MGNPAKLDRDVAALLAASALIEIRLLAGDLRRMSEQSTPEKDLNHIWFLADLCHNMPSIARPHPWRPSRRGTRGSSLEQAMAKRPMSWTWNTTGPEGRAWILRQIEQAGHRWTPPPPLPTALKAPSSLTPRQRIGVMLRRWPVKTPTGRRPLPPEAHVLKALDTDAVCALYEEAERLRLGLGKGGPRLRAHLDPDGIHYLVPDPADYYWPDPDGKIRWWQCTALLQMSDGEQVSSGLAVLPETFTALPSNLPRRQQLRLVYLARATERDTYLWSRDHKAECDPQRCGYPLEDTSDKPPPTA